MGFDFDFFSLVPTIKNFFKPYYFNVIYLYFFRFNIQNKYICLCIVQIYLLLN